MNFLHETIEVIKNNNYKIKNIIFIGSLTSGYSCSWEEFQILADKEYNNGYGTSEVAYDLVIIFNDHAKMIRKEYDGSEWWIFEKPITIPKKTKKIKSFFAKELGYESLKDINK